MKKHTKKIATILLVAVVAVGSYFVSSTYAKYTSEITGGDTATVAKWKWQFGSNQIVDSREDLTGVYTFNLFDTIKDTNADSPYGVSSSNETDVASGLIAPGTSGSFEIEITNLSDVNAQYAISLSETNNSNIPIEYSTDGTTWVARTSLSTLNIEATDIARADGTYNNKTDNDTLTVYWRWAYTGDQSTNSTESQTDVTDTNLGFAANTDDVPTVQVTSIITVTQVN